MERKWTIAIRPSAKERPRKITKIIGLKGKGFSVVTPYHKAQSGFLCKVPMDYSIAGIPGSHESRWEDTIGYTVEDRVKLSYHSDGFAQFSSERKASIISGRDPVTGQPKGLGLMTRPFKNPIWSGPSIAITIWGIEEYEEVQPHEKVLLFEPYHFYYRGCTPIETNKWILAIYVFPKRVIPPVRFNQGHCLLDTSIEGLNGAIASVVSLSVIHLPEEEIFLGLIVYCISGPILSGPSGWILSGPGDYTRDKKGHVLVGFYPREVIPVNGRRAIDRDTTTPL